MLSRFLYVALIILMGFALFMAIGLPTTTSEVLGLVFFAGLGLFFEALSIEIPFSRLTISVSFVPMLASILIYGFPVAPWVAAISSLNWQELKGGKPLYRNLFNLCQLALATSCGVFMYQLLGGMPGVVTLSRPLPLVATILAYMVVNAMLPSIAYAMHAKLGILSVITKFIAWSVPGYIATAIMGILAAIVFGAAGYAGVLLFTLPVLFTRMAFKLYSDMRRNYVETIQTLAQAIDAKDNYTRGHSERVAFYSVEIARHLGWGQTQLNRLQYLALLHDVGKIGVKEHVLNKKGRLTDEERKEVNRHPQIGADIVEKVGFLRDQSGFVRHHHERYGGGGGGGYPAGLAAEAIPLGARIIAVADAFDAMTSERVYQPARTAAAALEELQACKGTQFDPGLVDIFVGLATERDIIGVASQAVGQPGSYLAVSMTS